MSARPTFLTGKERFFGTDEIIVSKTTPTGHITYANEVFLRVSGYAEDELLGQPHSILRHPAMPRGVFKLLWDTIKEGNEIFAYVLNRSKCGDCYWVFAHVTPTFDQHGHIVGYHSSRRSPSRAAIGKIKPVYDAALREEAKVANPKLAAVAGLTFIGEQLGKLNLTYEEFVFTLDREPAKPAACAA